MMTVIVVDMTATMIEVIGEIEADAAAVVVDAAALAGGGCTVAKSAVSALRRLT
jgi:hypothetical protein